MSPGRLTVSGITPTICGANLLLARPHHRPRRSTLGVRGANRVQQVDELPEFARIERRHNLFVGGVDERIDLVEQLCPCRGRSTHDLPTIGCSALTLDIARLLEA